MTSSPRMEHSAGVGSPVVASDISTASVLTSARPGWLSAYDLVRIALALLLLTAAVLKSHQLLTEPVLGKGLWDLLTEAALGKSAVDGRWLKGVLESRWVLIGVVEFEVLFGFWLLGGFHPRPTWWITLLCFVAFSAVSLYKGLSGEASCGCFGRVQVNPWYTFTLDAAATLAILFFPPSRSGRRLARGALGVPLRFAVMGAVLVAVVLLVWLALGGPRVVGGPRASPMNSLGDVTSDGKLVILKPETWPGKPFALIEHIDVGNRLAEGQWLVLLYHHGCHDCERAIPIYEDLAGRSTTTKVALIEMPPYGNRGGHGPSGCVNGRLSDKRDWFATTPVVVLVREGKVLAELAKEYVERPEEFLTTQLPRL